MEAAAATCAGARVDASRAAQPKLQLRLKPVRPPPRPPEDFLEHAWSLLCTAVRSLFAGGLPKTASREELYRLVEAACATGEEASCLLATRLLQELEALVGQRLLALKPAAAAAAASLAAAAGASSKEDDSALLELAALSWRGFCDALREICMLFAPLDGIYFLPRHRRGHGVGSLWDTSLRLFRDRLATFPEVQEQVLVGLLRAIDRDRDRERRSDNAAGAAAAEASDAGALARLVNMLSALGIYGSFERRLFERAERYYRSEGAALVLKLPAEAYLRHVEKRLEIEERRCVEQLQAQSATALLELVRLELVGRQSESLLDTGFEALFASASIEDLERLYRLLEKVDELVPLRKAWHAAIRRAGAGVMAGADAEDARGVVPALMDFQTKLVLILDKAFKSSSVMALAMKGAFEEFLNAGPTSRPAKLLARYVDEVLRNEKACGDSELEEGVERVVRLFRHVLSKDAFELFYRKDLSKRLLHGSSSFGFSAGAEALMIQRLRRECGQGFTSKLEGMFRDVELSRGLLSDFLARSDARSAVEDTRVDFGVHILTTGVWPTQPPASDIIYPLVLLRLQQLFAAFYESRGTGRSLRWSPHLGQCVLRATFEGGVRKELAVSGLQALVLLLFNNSSALTCQQIAAATNIAKLDLQRTLQSLALHKTVKLLLKEPRSREVSDNDVFTFNAGFTNKLYRIVVSQITPKEQTEEEDAGLERRVFEDRQHEVDAALVRIMKAKRTLTHQQLLVELFAAVTFPMSEGDVKKRIDNLIEREYLERGKDNSSYNYLA